MQEQFEIHAQPREVVGRSANRRMRKTGQVPAVVYGGGKDPISLTVNHNELLQHLENEAFYSHILTLNVGRKHEKVILRGLQRHPSKIQVLHIDFLRVSEDQEITVHVPLHFINEDTCVGVKQQGGIVSHMQTDVEVACLPKHLPEYLEVDIADLGLGHSLHLSDLKLPKEITLVALSHGESNDYAVVSVIMPRVIEEIEPPTEEAEAEAAEAEAEVTEEGKQEDAKEAESSNKEAKSN